MAEPIASRIESPPKPLDFEHARERFLCILERTGVLKRKQVWIVDLDALRTWDYGEANKKFKRRGNRPHAYESTAFTHGKLTALLNAFRDHEVVSAQDYAAAQAQARRTGADPDNAAQLNLETKPLFYSPKTEEEAFSIDRIKHAQFYMGPWQLTSSDPAHYERPYPILAPNEHANFSEVALACMTYHPSFGDGKREDGTLTIKDSATGAYTPVTAERYQESFGFPGSSAAFPGLTFTGRPVEYLHDVAPRLIEHALLLPSDFKIQSQSATSERFRIVREQEGREKSYVMLDHVRYYLGRNFAGKRIRIYQISPTLGGIVLMGEREERLSYLFDIVPMSDPRLRMREDTEGTYAYKEASAEVTRVRPFQSAEIARRLPEEDDASYAIRVRSLTDFNGFLEFSHLLSVHARINLSQADAQTQLWAASAAASLESRRDDIVHLAQRFGLDGIRTLLSAEYGTEMGERIVALAQSPDTEAVRAVFHAYNQLIDQVLKITRRLKVSPEQLQLLQDAILFRGKEFLISASFTAQRGEHSPITLQQIITLMNAYTDFISRYTGIRAKQAADVTAPATLPPEFPDAPELEAIRLSHLECAWFEQMRQQEALNELYNVSRATEEFYAEYVRLNTDASETTGDTDRERARVLTFLNQEFPAQTPVQDRQRIIQIFDAGCGDGQRITEYIAAQRPDISITAGDLMAPMKQSHDRVRYLALDLTQPVGLKLGSMDAVMSTWSVVNDILRRQDQIRMFAQLSRMLQLGGVMYIDVPWLEGGVGSWADAAQRFQEQHPKEGYPFGMIEAAFTQVDGRSLVKKFDIYPLAELQQLLRYCGFEIMNTPTPDQQLAVQTTSSMGSDSPYDSAVWRTRSNASKPRITLIARKTKEPDARRLLLLQTVSQTLPAAKSSMSRVKRPAQGA